MKFLLNFIFDGFSKNDKKRILKNFFSQLNTNLFRLIAQFIFAPLMIFSYGLEAFGIWIFLTNIPFVIGALNLNLNEAAKIEMSIYFNKKNYKKVNVIFNNSIISTIIMVIFLVTISIIFINFYKFDLNILSSISSNYKNIISLILFAFFLDLLNNIFVNSITFFGRIDINSYLELFFDFFGKALIVLSGIFTGDLLIAAIFFAFNSMLKIIVYSLYFIKTNKYLKFLEIQYFSKKEIFRLFNLSIPHYLETINFIIRNSLQIILLGIFFNGQVVGMISALKTLFFFLPIRIFGIVSRSLLFEFTKSIISKKMDLLNKTLKKILSISIYISIIFLILSYFFGDKVFDFWLDNSYEVNNILILLICFDVIIISIGSFFKLVGKSINKFLLIMKIDLSVSILIILTSAIIFLRYDNYYLIFILNIIGSTVYAFFSALNYYQIVKKLNN